ncbi:ComEA family DNA-binding protein [Flagellimonas algicola]|uniref:Helix-hairpin-helix domain-containing protein n=1 Tax=Flagellimonas algicola TaxID=2583815 RepID=A0ABY2WGS9_9FLAO|nr:helix-hairpin-helix domain-containing protein [Allomuricauda algicola]TMU50479.1 helix-hairpin-helix domain-containing protein [Allomuricauda algicola]
MKKLRSHFRFNKQERSGIFFLLLLIIALQGVYFFISSSSNSEPSKLLVDNLEQSWVDSLQHSQQQKPSFKLYPFNPNFITEYKGYTLGIAPEELDRLYAFRKQGKYVNSAEEFQRVTLVSDSLLPRISPYFKFPDWNIRGKSTFKEKSKEPKRVEILDLNKATSQELKTIKGIGEKLSSRIVKFRDRLGGFLVDEQLNDVYGLEPEIVSRTLKKFKVLTFPDIHKVNINTATVGELSRLIYINQDLAQEIVQFRLANGSFQSLDDLTEVESFPKERIDRIKLYLTL